MEIEVVVENLIIDPVAKMPVVVLKEKGGDRILPIWIGFAEANGIAIALEGIKIPRPQTYDLFYTILTKTGFKISKVIINELKNNTYYAKIYLRNIDSDKELIIDARPSDSIALALRFNSIILAEETLLKKIENLSIDNVDDLKKWLEELTPEELGKYKM